MYTLTQQFIQAHAGRFEKVAEHDAEDADSADLVLLVYSPSDPYTEGEVLEISPATSDESLYFVALNFAHRFGGWPTTWRYTGTPQECLSALGQLLESESLSK